MNGVLPLRAGRRNWFEVIGGPYVERPDSCVGVKVAKEIARDCDYAVDIIDFSIPKTQQIDAVLLDVVKHILRGELVYVGCMGGRGRTGLFLAILAKAFGAEAPVQYVRDVYYPHAVETKKQHRFVDEYVVPAPVLKAIRWARFKAFFRRSGNLSR